MERDRTELSINFLRPLNGLKDGEELENMALIILNQPINDQNERLFTRLWAKAKIKFCVDGGTNRLYDWCRFAERRRQANETNNNDHDQYIPDYIVGDLDSIEDEIKNYYVKQGSTCVRLLNQDLTDFTKTLKLAVNCISNRRVDEDLMSPEHDDHHDELNLTRRRFDTLKAVKIETIYCFCEFTGRLDHALSNLSSLYDKCLRGVFTYMVSGESLTFLLNAGENVIYLDDDEGKHWCARGKHCGLFPLGEQALVTTHGFKWNLNEQYLKFGSFISSSNEFVNFKIDDLKSFKNDLHMSEMENSRCVYVKTDRPILFTMSI